MTYNDFVPLVKQTFRDPAGVAHTLMRAKFPAEVAWIGLVLTVLLGVLLAVLSQAINPLPQDIADNAIQITPFGYAIIMGVALILSVFALYRVGRLLGGQGRFKDVLVLMVWLQAVLLLFQVAQMIAALIVPPLSIFVTMASYAAGFWIMAVFVREAHRFNGIGGAIGTIILAFMAIGFGLSLILPILGVSIVGAPS